MSACARLVCVDLRLQDADVGQVAIPLSVVQTVADDELVGHVEAGVLTVDRYPLFAFLAQSATISSDAGLRDDEVLEQVLERETGVEDVLAYEHVATLDGLVEVLEDAHDSA